MESSEESARIALQQMRELTEGESDAAVRGAWPAVCEAAGVLAVDMESPNFRRTMMLGVSLLEHALQVPATHEVEAALHSLRVIFLQVSLWKESLAETCGVCGATPAEGRAYVGGVRYCHPDRAEGPTCYDRATWRGEATNPQVGGVDEAGG